MELNIWENWYEKILNDFNFSKEDDEKSACILSDILESQGCLKLEDFQNKFSKYNKAIVFGAGPSIGKHIKLIKSFDDLNDYILISADGATTALLKENIIPDIIITDLDGKLEDLLESNKKGSLMVIHAHGNNSFELKKYVNDFNNILGTTQSTPIKNLYDFGGFTDGDRAIFFAVELNLEKIILAGMDFGNIVTKFSRPNISNDTEFADEIKVKKLKYAEELTEWVKNNENLEMVNLK